MEQHVRALGVIYVILGILGILLGIALLVLMVGIGAASGDRDAGIIMGSIGLFVGLLIAILSIPTIVAGIGLQRYRPWARILALILAVLHIFNFPLGTAVGAYAFWVLLNDRTTTLFAAPAL